MLQRFSVSDLPLTPWKNGGGVTREIVCRPQAAGMDSFDWRISMATITRSGPFSVFAGIDRSIMLLAGGGVHLRHSSGIDHRLDTPARPFAFAGDVALDCTLLGSESTDFNVMTRRDVVTARVQVHAEDATLTPAASGLLMALRGGWRLSDGTTAIDIGEGQGVWWDGSPRAWQLLPQTADTALVSVAVTPRRS